MEITGNSSFASNTWLVERVRFEAKYEKLNSIDHKVHNFVVQRSAIKQRPQYASIGRGAHWNFEMNTKETMNQVADNLEWALTKRIQLFPWVKLRRIRYRKPLIGFWLRFHAFFWFPYICKNVNLADFRKLSMACFSQVLTEACMNSSLAISKSNPLVFTSIISSGNL